MAKDSFAALVNAGQDTDGCIEVVAIAYDKVIPNENNFYEIRDVDKLAEEISFSDFVSPLQVRDLGDGTYRLISGHKRRAAIGKLMANEKWPLQSLKKGMLPCIIRSNIKDVNGLTSEEVELCNLIFANKGQRDHYTVREQIREVEILKPIARKIYEQEGKKNNPGGFRNYFSSKWLDISGSELQRLESFSKLTKEAMELLDSGILSKSCAAEMAIMSAEKQMELINNFHESGEKEDFFTLSKVREYRKMLSRIDDICSFDSESPEIEPPLPDIPENNRKSSYVKRKHRKKEEKNYEMIMEVPNIPDEIHDSQEEACSWEVKLLKDFYSSLYDEVMMHSELEEDEKKRAQWGIRAAVIRMKLADLGVNSDA